MKEQTLDTIIRFIRPLGILAIIISVGTWAVDIADLVYHCPYCQTQRSVIGILGIFMLLPNPGHWIIRYVGAVFGFLGAEVASAQIFLNLRNVFAGEFVWETPFYLESFMLASFALFIIIGQVLLLFLYHPHKHPKIN